MYSIDELTLLKNWVFNIQESGGILLLVWKLLAYSSFLVPTIFYFCSIHMLPKSLWLMFE